MYVGKMLRPNLYLYKANGITRNWIRVNLRTCATCGFLPEKCKCTRYRNYTLLGFYTVCG